MKSKYEEICISRKITVICVETGEEFNTIQDVVIIGSVKRSNIYGVLMVFKAITLFRIIQSIKLQYS